MLKSTLGKWCETTRNSLIPLIPNFHIFHCLHIQQKPLKATI